mmetsp:Transcript_29915/g.96535  ORF Transcript_29915/g.96535 Transcript_29915/m.96535 type:complete len:238 (+) Transcript_29915:99-812(+)
MFASFPGLEWTALAHLNDFVSGGDERCGGWASGRSVAVSADHVDRGDRVVPRGRWPRRALWCVGGPGGGHSQAVSRGTVAASRPVPRAVPGCARLFARRRAGEGAVDQASEARRPVRPPETRGLLGVARAHGRGPRRGSRRRLSNRERPRLREVPGPGLGLPHAPPRSRRTQTPPRSPGPRSSSRLRRLVDCHFCYKVSPLVIVTSSLTSSRKARGLLGARGGWRVARSWRWRRRRR